MVARLVSELYTPLSKARLESYRPFQGSDEQMLGNYVWNVMLCESLYPALNALEIALRNAVHAALQAKFDTTFWFDQPGLLVKWQPSEVSQARVDIARRGKSVTDDRIVAELTCGFWTTILSRDYHKKIWNRNNAAPLAAAFPHLSGPGFRRDYIHNRFNQLRILRNRVFHFEPIYNNPNLARRHEEILEAVGWISPANLGLLSRIDRFPAVHQDGPTTARALTVGYAATITRDVLRPDR
jgi:hypothetical protein